MTPEPFRIVEETIPPGTLRRIEIPVARLPIHMMLHLPVTVIHGHESGARLWVSATLHGDEINGMEIVRRVIEGIDPERMHGTLLAVPIVNVFGFIHRSRYLPDRRDLNRSFPGSRRGSLASRLAHLFMKEIVSRCTHGIDLHSASPPRINLPQVRGNLEDPETRRCAEAFAAPVTVHSRAPRGALRSAASHAGVPTLLYEAGEPYRFNADAIETGVRGVVRVMSALGMIDHTANAELAPSLVVQRTSWVRARQSGVFYLDIELGQTVRRRESLGTITDPFGDMVRAVRSPIDGMVISHTNEPLVHRGDAIVHLAAYDSDGDGPTPSMT
jgi:predicted deacylase